MNSKKTNCLVAVLNIISIVAFYIFAFSAKYLMSSIMTGEFGARSIYNSFIINILLNNIQIILPVMYSGIGIIDIICAIQNKGNKKICFWQLVFGIYYLFTALGIVISLTDIDEDIVDWGNRIIFSVIPIILAIINFIRIRKNRMKVIQVISYIAVIILSILSLLDIIGTYWQIIAVVMQLIYIYFQDKNIEEGKAQKIINIILYYIFQVVLAVGFLGIVLASLIITKVNDDKCKNELENLYNNISSMQGVTNKDIYIPVERNYKYGFINEKGQEKIPCEYDRVSYFNEVEINNRQYYIAFAKKDKKFYIISKSNDVLVITNALEEYFQTMYEYLGESFTENINQDGNYRLGYLQAFEFIFQAFNAKEEIELTQQTLDVNNDLKEIFLTEQNSKYYYNNQNYSMVIEHVYDGSEEEEEYYNNYGNDGDYYYEEGVLHISSYDPKYKVTISKTDGEIQASIVHLPGIDENYLTLETFSNGYIEFENEDGTKGWYDNNGDKASISNNYTIIDITDDKVILQIDDDNEIENYDENTKAELDLIIIDMTGKTLLKTTALDIYDNMYLVKNKNKKMVLLDKDFNVISDEYDKIITNMRIDVSASYSSYY